MPRTRKSNKSLDSGKRGKKIEGEIVDRALPLNVNKDNQRDLEVVIPKRDTKCFAKGHSLGQRRWTPKEVSKDTTSSITTNLHRIRVPDNFVAHRYRVTFVPPPASDEKMRKLLNNLKDDLGENYVLFEGEVFTFNRELIEKEFLLEGDDDERNDHPVSITFEEKPLKGGVLQTVAKVILFRAAEKLGLICVNGDFYDSSRKIKDSTNSLELWRGVKLSIQNINGEIFLCTESVGFVLGKELQKFWTDLGLKFDLIKLLGRILPHPLTQLKKGSYSLSTSFWGDLLACNQLASTTKPLLNWGLIVPQRIELSITKYVQKMKNVGQKLGMIVKEPKIFFYSGNLNETLDEALANYFSFIFTVVPEDTLKVRSSVKRKCLLEHAVPCHLVREAAFSLAGSFDMDMMRIMIQLNAKLGNLPWKVDTPPGFMFIGMEREFNVSAFVATMDQQKSDYFFSRARHLKEYHSKVVEFSGEATAGAIDSYMRIHDELPKGIIVYMMNGLVCHKRMREILEKLYAAMEQELKIAFVSVDTGMSTRFFREKQNVLSGTIVDSVITDQECVEFYLQSQSSQNDVARPVKYTVISDTLNLAMNELQEITYNQCHMHYRYLPCRVPAICQYANDLAQLVARELQGEQPNARLNGRLFFL